MKKQKLFTLIIPMIFLFGNVGIGQVYVPGDHNDWDLDADNKAEEKSNLGTNNYYGITIQPSVDDEFKVVHGSYGTDWGGGYWIDNYDIRWTPGWNGNNAVWKDSPDSYIHICIEDPEDYHDTNIPLGIMTLTSSPISISSVTSVGTQENGTHYVEKNTAKTVDIDLSASPSSEKVYLRYTTDGWTSDNFVEASGSGTDYSAEIPGQNSGTVIEYYVLTTTLGYSAGNDLDNYTDLMTIDYENNSGSNYSYKVAVPSTSGGGEWNASSTWLFNSEPANDETVVISGNTTVDLTSTKTCNDLTVEQDGTLQINTNGELTVDGDLAIETAKRATGNLTIKSDATGTGSLIVKGTLSGNATAQRYIAGHSGDNTTGWHLLSPPIGTFTINNNADFDPGNNDDVYGWSESSYTWMNHKQGNPSDMVPGTGYLVSYESTATKNFTGTLNNSDITHNDLSVNPDGNGWHLLGNPFPSALHWEEDGDWSIDNFASGAKIMNPGGSYTDISTGGANQYIPAHQGFFVQATTDGSNSITIPKADREHNSTSFYKSEVNNLLTLKASQGNKYVETWLQMKEGATVDYDEEYDIHFLGGMEGTPYLYSIADNEEYVSTNRIPHDISDTEIPLGFKVFNDGEVTMEWKNLDSFENDVDISLTDLKTEKTINLDESDSYTFTASTDDDVNRFVLNFKSAIGIDEQSDELEGVSIYSHDNRIFVNSGDELTNAELSVYNTLGQLVSRESYKSGDKVISVDQRGAYIVRIQAEEGVATEKVIIR